MTRRRPPRSGAAGFHDQRLLYACAAGVPARPQLRGARLEAVPGGDFSVSLFAVTATGPTAIIPIASVPITISSGHGGATVNVGQAVFRPGFDLCVSTSSSALTPSNLNVVRGFLAKDK